MRFFTSTLALFLSIIVVGAIVPHGNVDISARHNRLSRRSTSLEVRAAKKCPNRTNKNVANNNVINQQFVASHKASPTPSSSSSSKKVQPTPAPAKLAPVAPTVQKVSTNGLINVKSNCGPSGATRQVTKLSGPNGNIDWINCGFETSGGWQPPYVRMEDIITQSLSSAVQSPSSPFKACSAYIWIFEKYGNQYGIPPIILASFAMQESSCNPNTVGGAGEQGLMQITRDKCGGAPGGNCKDPEFNIRTATSYFKNTLDGNNGDVFLSVGTYNGWHRGLTEWQAFAAANTACCRCQNNGDYLHQFFNGWCQNINAYDNSPPLGKYFNLDQCN
ncbi:lysozyme-like domain-containing protein [Flammula alnicola]|nr:lysozyme-like domain-containing protein [Flammula alnicola]